MTSNYYRHQRAALGVSIAAVLALVTLPVSAAAAAPAASNTDPTPAPTVGASCSVGSGGQDTDCWSSTAPVILAIELTDKNDSNPEYIVKNADGSQNHRNQFQMGIDEGYNRIWLNTGQTLTLTPPNSTGMNRIKVAAITPQDEGARPEVGEKCVSKYAALPGYYAGDPCFVVAKYGYSLKIEVLGKARDAPEYVVRRDGEDQHGNRLELDSDGSLIHIDAGDQLFLMPPLIAGTENRIEITEVVRY